MKHIGDIDPLVPGRPNHSYQERENLSKARLQQQKEDGYQQLVELCRLGEYDAARQLANRNSRWGYQIVGGEVMERSD